ncbi:MAG: YhbY family RNA-binding protein, partial [Eubacteriales bacterium]|nr:YhbY family RNA-binding protein [Eubacteriales bacterium]
MITAKQRGALRRMANPLQPIFQIGKGGIGENLLKQLDDALQARELITISVLESADVTAGEASEILC